MTSSPLLQHLQTLGIDALRLTAWLVILAMVFVPLERLFSLQPRTQRRPQTANDLAYYFLVNLTTTAILALPLALLAATARAVVPAAWFDAMATLPLAARVGLALLATEIGSYWGHRWSHEWPWLWRFHAVHHSPTRLDWLVNSRAHPVDMAFTRLCGLTPVYLLGLAQPSAAGAVLPMALGLFSTAWSFFIHADLRWRLGPLEALLSTPAFHHWHHTNEIEHRDRNYAALLPVVDRLFGTHHLPRHWPPSYGIDAPMPPSLWRQLVDPITGRL